jgi:low affinity Fe/Cu permease
MPSQRSGHSHERDKEPGQLHKVQRRHIQRARARTFGAGKVGLFRRFARTSSAAMGRPWAFCCAVLVVIGWAVLGPIFDFSDTWQLVINTGTTIITFLMVFLIQNTQNRDTEALRLKLDELILATRGARNEFVDLDDLDDEQLEALEHDLRSVAQGTEQRADGMQAARRR